MAALTEQRARAVLDEYERALAGAPLARHTRRAYRSRVAGYLRWLTESGGDAVALDTPYGRDEAVRRYRHVIAAQTRPATVNAVLTALDHFYQQLRLGPVNTGRERVPDGVRQALPPQARDQLLRAVDAHDSARDRAIAYTLLFTGVRVGELVALDVPDVRLPAPRSRLLVRGDPAVREIPLHSRPRPVLRAWLAQRRQWPSAGETPALFLNRRGGRLSTRSIDELVARLGQEAGLPGRLTPQVLRHTFGASLVRGGADLLLVAALMGHKRLDSTRRYADEEPDAQRVADVLTALDSTYHAEVRPR